MNVIILIFAVIGLCYVVANIVKEYKRRKEEKKQKELERLKRIMKPDCFTLFLIKDKLLDNNKAEKFYNRSDSEQKILDNLILINLIDKELERIKGEE